MTLGWGSVVQNNNTIVGQPNPNFRGYSQMLSVVLILMSFESKEYFRLGADHLSLSTVMFNPFKGSKLVQDILSIVQKL